MLSKFSCKKGECVIIWKLENFSFTLKNNSIEICSVEFCSEMVDYTNWVFALHKGNEDIKFIRCSLRRSSGGPDTVNLSFQVIVLSPDGNDLVLTDVATHTFEKFGKYISETLTETSLVENSLWKDTLILKCCLRKTVCENLVSKTFVVRSRNEFERKDFLWTLKRFDSENNYVENTSITLKSHLHGISALNVELISKLNEIFLIIRISSEKYPSKDVSAMCEIFLLDNKGSTLAQAEDEHTFSSHCRSDIWRFPNFIRKYMLVDSVFHLKFQLTVFANSETTSEKSFYNIAINNEEDELVSKDNLNNDLLRLYNERKFSDVTLKVGDKEFDAHKNILAIRSPVFDTIFQKELLENKSKVINITDVDAEILKMLLEYVYSDQLCDTEMEKIMKLYQAADKYQIVPLKAKCSSFLKSSLTSSNVVRVLAFSDDHQDDNLKTSVKDFICIFGYELFDSNMWQTFMKERVYLATEIMHQVTLNCLKIS